MIGCAHCVGLVVYSLTQELKVLVWHMPEIMVNSCWTNQALQGVRICDEGNQMGGGIVLELPYAIDFCRSGAHGAK